MKPGGRENEPASAATEAQAEAGPGRYKAFISYSHFADLQLSAAVQTGLHRFAKPWYRLRAIRVFRDRTNLSVTPALWPSIEQALTQSEFFLLMASPAAAQSVWVEREIQRWKEERSPNRLFLILTEGQMVWDDSQGDFDWTVTTALPPGLRDLFEHEPRWVDLRWARTEEHLSLSHPQFRDSIAELAAPLHQVEKDEIIGEDVRQHRRTLAVAWSAAILLFLLAVIALGMAVYAFQQRDLAQTQALIDRGARAAILAQQPGREIEALRLAVGAAEASLKTGRSLPPEVFEGLTAAATKARYLVPLRGPRGAVQSVRFSPDGRRVVSAGDDGTAHVWSTETGDVLQILRPGGSVQDAIFSVDGLRVITAGDDAKIWDLKTGNVVAILKGHSGPVLHLAVSADGSRILSTGEDGTGRIWNSTTGGPLTVLRGHTAKIVSGEFAHRGHLVVTAGWDDSARLWDGQTGRLLAVFPHDQAVQSASFTADDSRILTADWGGHAHVWRARGGRRPVTFTGHTGPVLSAQLSPDETRVVTASYDGTVRLWDTATGREVGLLRGHAGSVESAAFSPDGSRIVSAGWDRTARLWDARTQRPIALLAGTMRRLRVARFSPDGMRIVTSGDDPVSRIWDARLADFVTALYRDPGDIWCLAITPDGMRVVSGHSDRSLRILGRGNETISTLRRNESAESAQSASLSPDGRRAAIGDSGGRVEVFDTRTGALTLAFQAHKGPVKALTFSERADRLVTMGEDGRARVWDACSGVPIADLWGHRGPVLAGAFFARDARILTGGQDETARIWNAQTGRETATLRGHVGPVSAVAVSPDGTRLATGSEDHSLILWDGATGRQVAVMAGHGSDVLAAAFSRDGRRLVSAALDDSVRLWDVASGKALATFQTEMSDFSADLRVAWIWFTPQGDEVVAAGFDGTAKVFPVRLQDFLARARSILRNHGERSNLLPRETHPER